MWKKNTHPAVAFLLSPKSFTSVQNNVFWTNFLHKPFANNWWIFQRFSNKKFHSNTCLSNYVVLGRWFTQVTAVESDYERKQNNKSEDKVYVVLLWNFRDSMYCNGLGFHNTFSSISAAKQVSTKVRATTQIKESTGYCKQVIKLYNQVGALVILTSHNLNFLYITR